MIRHALRRPLLSSAVALAAVSATAAGYAASSAETVSAAPTTYKLPVPASQLAPRVSGAAVDEVRANRLAIAAKQQATQAAQAKAAATKAAADRQAKALAAAQAQAAAAKAAAARKADAARASRAQERAAISSADPKSIAQSLLAQHGWSGQFSCLDSLWTKESGWNVHANNPSSGAYGIPQALPGSKMASEGSDWQSNPTTQIKWGLNYIESTYGSPCSAWNHSQANGWY